MQKILVVILFVCLTTAGFATHYYVDADADAGGDGTTAALTGPHCAWDTLADVRAFTFAPGDAINFNRGDIWRADFLTPDGNGTLAAPIIYQAYGTGSNPRFSGSADIGSVSWLLEGGTEYRTTDLDAAYRFPYYYDGAKWHKCLEGTAGSLALYEWDWDGVNFHINIGIDPTGEIVECPYYIYPVIISSNKSNIVFDSIDFWGCNQDNVQLSNSCNNVRFVNCNISFSARDGLNVKGTGSQIIADGCTCEYNGDGLGLNLGDGITFHDTTMGVVKNCTLRYNTSGGIAHIGPTTVLHENCYFEDNGVNLKVLSSGLATFTNCVMVNTNDSSYSVQVEDAGPPPYTLTCELNHCVLYGESGNTVTKALKSRKGNVSLRNSIVTGFDSAEPDGVGVWLEAKTDVHLTLSNNCVWNNRINYVTVTADDNSISEDPLFKNPSARDFRISTSSPSYGTRQGIIGGYGSGYDIIRFGVDKYVATTGSDTTGDGTPESPYATIGKAYSVLSGKDNSIYVDEGTYTGAYESRGFLNLTADDVGFTLQPKDAGDEVIFSSTHASNSPFYMYNLDGANISVEGITITTSSTPSGLSNFYATAGHGQDCKISFTNCEFVGTSSMSVAPLIDMTCKETNNSSLLIDNCTIAGYYCAVRAVKFFGGSGGIIDIRNNSISLTPTLPAQRILYLGVDGGTTVGKIGRTTINNNTISYESGTISHSILIGHGCDNAVVSGNTVSGGDIQLVLKGESPIVYNNVLSGENPLLLKGARNALVKNNKIIGTTGVHCLGFNLEDETLDSSESRKWTLSVGGSNEYYCELMSGLNIGLREPDALFVGGVKATKGTIGSLLPGEYGWGDADSLGAYTVYVRLSDDTDPDTKMAGYVVSYHYPSQNIVTNNIITSSGAAYVVFFYSTTVDIFNNYLDYNMYYTDGTKFAGFNSGSYATHPLWLVIAQDDNTYDSAFADLMDKNSLIQNPGSSITIIENGIVYGLENTSSVSGPLSTDICVEPPYMDSNGDCKVDFLDFCEFAAEWMSCGLENQSACWE